MNAVRATFAAGISVLAANKNITCDCFTVKNRPAAPAVEHGLFVNSQVEISPQVT